MRTVGRTMAAAVMLAAMASRPGLAQVCGDGAVEGDEGCDDGNAVGGDGCASNCTAEFERRCELVTGSSNTIVTPQFPIQLAAPQALLTLTFGRARASDPSRRVPVVARGEHLRFAPGRVPGLSCSCLVSTPPPGEPADVIAEGVLGCAPGGRSDAGYLRIFDSASGESSVAFLAGPRGALTLTVRLKSYTLADGGTCCHVAPGDAEGPQGADGVPCTADDPGQAEATEIHLTTDAATTRVLNPNGAPGMFERGVFGGPPLDCAAPDLQNVALVAARHLEDAALGDVIQVLSLFCGAPSTAPATPTCGPEPAATATASEATPPPTATATGTPAGTAAATPTGTMPTATSPSPTQAATPSVAAPCVGDCDGDGAVRVNEVVRGVLVAVGAAALETCPTFDDDGDGLVSIAELVRGVNAVLAGCT